MIKKNKLIINENPYIRSYTYHGFFHAIISGNNKVGNNIAHVNIKNINDYSWEIQNEQVTYSIEGNNLYFTSNEWNTNMNICFWRHCLDYDEIEISIEKQLYSNVWGAINIFITSCDQQDMLCDDEYIYRLGNFNKEGVYLRINNITEKIPSIHMIYPLTLRITKKDKTINAYYIHNNELMLLNTYNYTGDKSKFKIGFEIKLGNNSYYEWLFTNYIQTYGNINSITSIDFLWNPHKNWNTYTTNYFLDYNIENIDAIQSYGLTLLKFIKKTIDLSRYIEMWLNENILDNKEDIDGAHFHQNLIYGYDDEKKILNVLQFVNGIPTEREMKYIDFSSERNINQEYKNIIVITYNPDYVNYEVSLKYLVNILIEYYHSINTSSKMQHLFMSPNTSFGIKLLDDFLSDKGIDTILFDVRVSHLLFERARCMKDRVEYFKIRNLLDQEQYLSLIDSVNLNLNNTMILRNLVLKYKLKNNLPCKNTIKKILNNIKETECKYIPLLINYLSEKCNYCLQVKGSDDNKESLSDL